MAETTEHRTATLRVVWNPITGEIDYAAEGATYMEQLAMLQVAIHTLLNHKKTETQKPNPKTAFILRPV